MSLRQNILFFIAAVLILPLSSCSQNSSKEVADKFLKSFYKMDYVDAKNYATDKTKEMLTTIEQLKDDFKKSADGKIRDVKVEIVNVEENDDKSVVTYNLTDGEGMATKNIMNRKLHLIKEKGEWKVNFTKENNMPEIEKIIGDDTPDADAQQ